jgi:hypothetical protein
LAFATRLAVARDPHGDLRIGLAAQPAHGVVEGHVERRLVVDLDDAIEALEAGASRRRIGHRVHDGEALIADRDHDAEAAEGARGGEVHLLVRLGAHEHAVRIERVEHAVARRVLDLAEVHVGALQVLSGGRRRSRAALPRRPRAPARCRCETSSRLFSTRTVTSFGRPSCTMTCATSRWT